MPVIGHAFVGLATAIQCEPSARRDGGSLSPAAAASWTAAIVALAYLPDGVAQAGAVLGARQATLFGHSLVVGATAGVGLGAAFAIASGLPIVRVVLVAVGSVLGHDALDLLQGSDRPLFWPWSMKAIASVEWIPTRTAAEGLLFFVLFLAFAAWRIRSGRSLGSLGAGAAARQSPALRWATCGAVAAIIAAAVLTHMLRSRHERLLNSAARLVEAGRFEEALRAADAADGWPTATRPGRIDLIRAEAYVGLGQPGLGEALYRHAYDEDPTNFWAVADLAEFYAAGDRPLVERRRLTQVYVAQLRERFAHHRALPRVLAGIERRLARDPLSTRHGAHALR